MTDQAREPSDILKDLRAKSKLIVHLQGRANRGEFKSMADAQTLQRTRRERQRLMDNLPPLRLVN